MVERCDGAPPIHQTRTCPITGCNHDLKRGVPVCVAASAITALYRCGGVADG
ncbi:MAG: hypothetical protein IH987_17950 [Planctomycetes bacterium]|nr:hypothetical protein [Planctomycetota bacterium]